MNEHYVYIYYRLDTNEPFYVGMGKGRRWKRLDKRNRHFKNIINKIPIACEIVMNNLTEEQAHEIECWIINELVFKYGYSIDIPNNYSSEKGCHLVNMTWGGEGTCGINAFEHKTKKEMREIKIKISKNRDYKRYEEHNDSKIVVCLNTNEIFKCIKYAKEKYGSKDISGCCKKKKGRNSSGTYNNERLVWRYLKDYLNMNKEEIKNTIAKGQLEPDTSPKNVICLTTLKIFSTIKDGSIFYKIDSSSLSKHCKGKGKTCGKLSDGTPLVWMYLKDFLEKCEYITL